MQLVRTRAWAASSWGRPRKTRRTSPITWHDSIPQTKAKSFNNWELPSRVGKTGHFHLPLEMMFINAFKVNNLLILSLFRSWSLICLRKTWRTDRRNAKTSGRAKANTRHQIQAIWNTIEDFTMTNDFRYSRMILPGLFPAYQPISVLLLSMVEAVVSAAPRSS